MLNMLLPKQSRAARALLGWNQNDLARESGVSLGTIKDFESGRHQLNAKALGELARAYQKAGLVLFFEDDNGDVGVRLKKKKEASE
jgi:transcriptional regulator with XRE-family HTH domain